MLEQGMVGVTRKALSREISLHLLPVWWKLTTSLNQPESLDLPLEQLMVLLHRVRFLLHDALRKSILLLVVLVELREQPLFVLPS